LSGLVQSRCWNIQHKSRSFSFCCICCWNSPQLVLSALASSLCCSCLVNIGVFLVTEHACCGAWKCCRWILSGGRFLLVSVIVVSSDSLLQASDGMAVKHALVCMLSAFRCFSCWFGFRCTRNCGSPLVVAWTRSVSGHGMKFPVAIDVLGLFHAVGVSLLDLSSHTVQASCEQLPPASLFAEFWNFVLHFSASSQESLLLNAAVPSSPCTQQHLVFLKCDLGLSGMWAPTRSASQADSHPSDNG